MTSSDSAKEPTWDDDLFENPRLSEALSREVGIEWIADLADLDYVRQSAVITHARKGYLRCPTAPEGRTVGYTILDPATKPEWPPRGFLRRVFWVKPHDRSEDPGGIYAHDCPTEAVDPRTVAPGQEGYVTIRARGRSEVGG